MAYEDFTAYTEVDPNNQIGLVGTDHLDISLHRNADAYLYDDKGAGHFGDYEHLIDFKFISHVDNATYSIDLCANNIDDSLWIYNNVDGLGVRTSYSAAPGYTFYLTDFGNINSDQDNIALTTGTWYYLTIKRLNTTATCKIYSNKARTVLIDTMTIVCKTTTYRYIYAVNSWNSGSNAVLTSDIEDLDLQEIETHTPSDTAGASDALTFKAEVPIEDTAKASDSIGFFKGLRFAIGDTAKASDDLTFGAEIDIEDIAKASDIFASDAPSVIPCECPTFTLNGTSTSILFPKPEWANPNNEISKNVSLFNFWSGDIDTVDKGINTQTLTIGGTVCICGDGDWKNTAAMTTWLDSIKTASNDGEEFTINELGNCLNGVYIIKNFAFNTLQGTADCFTWSLNLERVCDI